MHRAQDELLVADDACLMAFAGCIFAEQDIAWSKTARLSAAHLDLKRAAKDEVHLAIWHRMQPATPPPWQA